jgi:hypothetical protein
MSLLDFAERSQPVVEPDTLDTDARRAYDAGYYNGYADALAKIAAEQAARYERLAERAMMLENQMRQLEALGKARTMPTPTSTTPKPATLAARILSAVEAQPGLTIQEIRATFHAQGRDIDPGVLRATLHRLKFQNRIAARLGKWFPNVGGADERNAGASPPAQLDDQENTMPPP